MLFNSFQFVLFFPSAAGLYFLAPHRFRWCLLLAASYFFYMCWEPGYLILILISTLVDYTAGILMGRSTRGPVRRCWLILSLSANLGLLFFFKYYNFFSETLRTALAPIGFDLPLPVSRFLLPVGISFYTFQTMGYAIDVYRGVQEPQKHLGIFALYVAFFPQLVAGPIERAHRLIPQLIEEHRFDYDRVANGVKLMVWGLFKKVVIADRLAALADPVYNHPMAHQGPLLTMATVFFAFQIYCDFSGYTDIAIGAARVFGVRLIENFNRPYFARSMAQFWRRWHISLSTWFRDYLYIPLGGNRATLPRWCANMLAVFALSGLWHGANWTFLAWGLLHAVYIIGGARLRTVRGKAAAALGLTRTPRLLMCLQAGTTFALVCLGWIVFRARRLSEAAYVVTHLLEGWPKLLEPGTMLDIGPSLGIEPYRFVREFLLSVGLIGFLLGVQFFQSRTNMRDWLAARPGWFRFGVYSLALWTIFLFGVFRQKEFIYFTF